MKSLKLIAGCVLMLCVLACDIALDFRHTDYEDTMIWVWENIEYTLDGEDNNWQTPKETLDLMTGDCEDMTFLFMYLVKEDFGMKGEFVVVYAEGYGYHALSIINGVYYDPTHRETYIDLPDGWVEIERKSYDISMAMTLWY